MMGGGRAGRRRSTSEWAYGGGGAVLALDGHAATEVEGLEAKFVILFLQQIERIHGLVQLENDAPRRVLVHAQPLRAARHHKMRAVRRDRQRRRPRLRPASRTGRCPSWRNAGPGAAQPPWSARGALRSGRGRGGAGCGLEEVAVVGPVFDDAARVETRLRRGRVELHVPPAPWWRSV